MEQTAVSQALDRGLGVETVPVSDRRDFRPALHVTISSRFLLGIYAVLPLCLLMMISDQLFWGGALFSNLPTSPDRVFAFQLLFGTPHIIASSVILVTNSDYFRAYRVRLGLLTLIILAFFGLGSLFIPYHLFVAFVGTWTIWHVLKQQVGIGRGLCRLSGRLYDIWGWTLVLMGALLYYPLYTGNNFAPATARLAHGALWLLSALTIALTLICHRRITNTMGRLYLWANALMVLQSVLLYARGYFFLAVLGPRLVHDLTAFTFYVAHDVNRHGVEAQNLLYRLARKLRLNVFWVCPVVAVLLTYLIGRLADPIMHLLGYNLPQSAGFLIVGYLGLLHYYTEAYTWQRGSPYRRYIALTS